MDRTLAIEMVDNCTIKIIDDFDISPWSYAVLLNNKWYQIYLDSNIIKFPRDISSYFLMIDELNKTRNDNKIIPVVKICLDLLELKKLEKIDKINPGQSVVPIMPEQNNERLDKLEKQLEQKTKQLIMLSSKLDNLENLLKKSLGFN